MPKVIVYGKENLEKALKTFKARCKREGIFQQCKEKRHYVKPSVKRRQMRINKKRKSQIKPINGSRSGSGSGSGSGRGRGKYERAKK